MSSSNLTDRAGRADQADRIISIIACRLSRELDSMKEILDGVAGSGMIDLLRVDIRHRMAQNLLGLFTPLSAYSPIALDNSLDGEANVFRILQLNQRQRVDAYYIAGTDHYYRYNPETRKPDTIQKLENGVRGKIFAHMTSG